jgi:nicotinamide phosphoribosyltransferase
VPEGSVVPTSNVLMTIENTDPACYWLTNYLEILLVQVWYPCTVATQSRSMKQTIANYLQRTGDIAGLRFKLHDFGFRGVSSIETAEIGGAAHLVNFTGTDNIAGVLMARRYYGAEMPGFSIPASEHSTITSWGREREADAYANMLSAFPQGFVAVVSDSYDIFNVCSNLWGGVLKEKVIERDGTLVIRPDSGDPPTIVVEVLLRLGEAFGFSTNDKGYRILDPHVRVIQGDGIDRVMLVRILEAFTAAGWSTENLAFGSGGGLLQKLNRDTGKFAFKCSSATVDGKEIDVFKQPVTDQSKVSKAGRLKLIRQGESLATVRADGINTDADLLEDVFENGRLLREETWPDICRRAQI